VTQTLSILIIRQMANASHRKARADNKHMSPASNDGCEGDYCL
jgi:hypothetical protein